MPRLRVFIATSLDGFIAGPNDELDFLDVAEGAEDTFTPFIAGVGALLMGRRTYDVASGFPVPWPYGELPVLVATSRPLVPKVPSVRAVHGDLASLVAQAIEAAAGKDVYVDGGALIRAALEAGLVDEVTVTVIPVVLGRGIPLFSGTSTRVPLSLVRSRELGKGLVQLTYDVVKPA